MNYILKHIEGSSCHISHLMLLSLQPLYNLKTPSQFKWFCCRCLTCVNVHLTLPMLLGGDKIIQVPVLFNSQENTNITHEFQVCNWMWWCPFMSTIVFSFKQCSFFEEAITCLYVVRPQLSTFIDAKLALNHTWTVYKWSFKFYFPFEIQWNAGKLEIFVQFFPG